MEQQYTGLQKAIQRVGSVERFARTIGVTNTVVLAWLKDDGTEAPPETRPANTGIRNAVTKAGGAAALARALNVSAQAVGIWLRQGYCPAQRALEIEHLFGVPRDSLMSLKMRNALGAGGEL